jgi:hypothetical protein
MDATGVAEPDIDNNNMESLKAMFVTDHGPLEVDDAERQRMFVDLKQAHDNDSVLQKEIVENFERGYQKPVPSDALKEKWRNEAREASKPNAAEPQWEALQDDFVRDYAATHMKGRKNGTWVSIFGELFKKGLFDFLG